MRSSLYPRHSFVGALLLALLVLGTTALPIARAQETTTPIVVDFWHIFSGALADRLTELVTEFEAEHPDIDINLIYVPYDAMLQNVLSAVAAGTPPPLAQLELTLNGRLAAEGALAPVETLLAPEAAEALKASIIPSIAAANTYDDLLVTVPMGYNSNVLYYNPALLTEAGIDPATDMPRTWDELIAVAQQLTVDANNDGEPEVYGYGFPTHAPWILEVRLWQSGAEIFADDNASVVFNSDAAASTFANYLALVESGAALPVATDTGVNQLTDLFAAGRIAMFEQSSTAFFGIDDRAEFEIGVSGFPTMGEDVFSMGGYNLGIFNQVSDEQKAAAATFVQWWTTPEIAARWTQISNYMPGIEAAWDTETLSAWTAEDPRRTVAAAQMPYAHPRPNQPDYPQIGELLATAFETALAGQASPADALEQAAQQANAVLAQ